MRKVWLLALALLVPAPAYGAPVCGAPVTVVVNLPDMFDILTQDALKNGGTLHYDVVAAGSNTKNRTITVDLIVDLIAPRGPSTFTVPPRVQADLVGTTPKRIVAFKPLVVAAGTSQLCVSAFAHPSHGDCGVTDVRSATELGSHTACINELIVD